MACALLDISAVLFDPCTNAFKIGQAFSAISAFGLRVIGSAPSDEIIPTVRLIVEDAPGRTVLPAECRDGWRLISLEFESESVGDQRLVRVAGVHVAGTPRMRTVA